MRYVLAAVALICATYSIAYACDCIPPSMSTAAAQAKTVFVAKITKVHEHKSCDPKRPTWCSRSFTYDVAVEAVFKGTVGKAVVLDGGTGDCAHGALGKPGARWLVLTRSAKEPFELEVCSGTQRATPRAIAAVAKALGRHLEPRR